MFTLRVEEFGAFKQLSLENKKLGVSLKLLPELGGIPNALHFNIRDYDVNILEGYENSEVAANIEGYRNAWLIPFPNRLKDAKYTFQEELYELPMNWPQEQHAIHGLFYNKPFELIEKELSSDKAILVFSYRYDGSIKGYPFVCETKIQYELGVDYLNCTLEIINKGYSEMPIAAGWHPYFKFGHSIDKCNLSLSAAEQVLVDERMLAKGYQKNPFSEKSFSLRDQHFDTGFKFSSEQKPFSTRLYSENFGASLVLWQDASFPFVQVYTPKDRNSIAIEPMSCNINAFNNQDGLSVLEPNASFKGQFGLKIQLD